MATQVEQLYGPEHFDSNYYETLKAWLGTQHFTKGVEVGFAWAMSAMAFLETQPEATLLSVDMNDGMVKAQRMKEAFGDRWELQQGDSSTILKALKAGYDWIYIDGDHTYEGVKKDLEAAWHLMGSGVTMVCDDYGNPCGVKQAVDEYVSKHKLEMGEVTGNPNGSVWLRVP